MQPDPPPDRAGHFVQHLALVPAMTGIEQDPTHGAPEKRSVLGLYLGQPASDRRDGGPQAVHAPGSHGRGRGVLALSQPFQLQAPKLVLIATTVGSVHPPHKVSSDEVHSPPASPPAPTYAASMA